MTILKNLRDIKYIVIHCSDSPDDLENIGAEQIHDWHVDKGWSGIGYHYVIKRDGMSQVGRPEYWVGAHVRGFNEESIGICLVGREAFTERQWRTLRATIKVLSLRYPGAKIVGHNELDPKKTCPNFDVFEWLKSIEDTYV